ncbi:hypothetical protein CRV15_00280 [Streptomyces clavuligerus]|uniref:Uncharacterized protein n=1 Tax=Streptomyces clavuligerus TaxID=1901 RepID=B5GZC7_STRCL|nr:hypothetical protein D1794_00280 [Streptomyces clavuligerus]EDY51673.1 hypothetical protein SSCG_04701 [Streptomyces clavuligerus]EFG10733.1 Hypothetical protein SCLAV_5666 [Streptomyces clavuligerus]QCS04162.1 hypothetical protein CRV15_00280 [Streptomyces clavuligerus]QPJ96452.1 hypothetical protein GE265_27585 [Streptomyces clavuligerus]
MGRDVLGGPEHLPDRARGDPAGSPSGPSGAPAHPVPYPPKRLGFFQEPERAPDPFIHRSGAFPVTPSSRRAARPGGSGQRAGAETAQSPAGRDSVPSAATAVTQ